MAFNCFNNLFISILYFLPSPSQLISWSSYPIFSQHHLHTYMRVCFKRRVERDCVHSIYIALLLVMCSAVLTSVSSSSSSHFGSIEFHSILDTLLLLIINFILCCLRNIEHWMHFFVCQKGWMLAAFFGSLEVSCFELSSENKKTMNKLSERRRAVKPDICCCRL